MTSNLDVLGGINDSAAYKAPVAAATTSDLTGAMIGLLVVDGYQTVAGDRILVWQNTDETTNGVYTVNSGAWTRASDFSNSSAVVQGTQVFVNGGVQYSKSYFAVTTIGLITFGASDITFENIAGPVLVKTSVRYITSGSSDTATANDIVVAWKSATASAKTQNIQGAVSIPSGQSLTIYDAQKTCMTYPITITPASGTIAGATSFVLNQVNGASVTFISDGISNWIPV